MLHYDLSSKLVAIKENTCIIMPTISPFGLDGNKNTKSLSPFDIKGKGWTKMFSPFDIHYVVYGPPEFILNYLIELPFCT